MPRCKKRRNCRGFKNSIVFKPAGITVHDLEMVVIELDEFEAIRLCDYEDKNQIEASEMMHVSRATVQRLLTSGRKKIVDSILHSKGLRINNSQDVSVNEETMLD